MNNNSKCKGVNDLMKADKIKPSRLVEILKDNNVPGNWDSYRNIYNLVHGRTIPDPKAFIVLAKLFCVQLIDIVNRYSRSEDETLNINTKSSW